MTLTAPVNAVVSPGARSATGTIVDDDESPHREPTRLPLALSSLQVTGAASELYPAFAADIRHYALTCDDATTLRVVAESSNDGASVTLLRKNPNDNHVSNSGALDQTVSVDQYHDRATLNFDVDCRVVRFPDRYAVLNSIKIFDGDIVASLRGCAQVLRIDRSGGTGAVVWKLGGTDPGPVGGVTILENGRWLIAWGQKNNIRVSHEQSIAVSEVDPEDGTVHLQLGMSRDDRQVFTYRSYRIPEADVEIPLNLVSDCP